MKVLHVTPSFYPALIYGGPTHSVYNLCLALADSGCEVRVLTTDANGPDAVLDVETDREKKISTGLFVRYCHRIFDVSVSPSLLWQLIPYVRWADVVHLMAVYSFPTIPVLLAARAYGKPVVWSPRGMLQRWGGTKRPILKTFWEQVCRLVSPDQLVLHVTSEGEATESRQRLPNVATAVVPNGVNVPESISHVPGDGELRIIFLGRLDPKKGIENLLAAFRILSDRARAGYTLKIAGAGAETYVASLASKIRSYGLSGCVALVGKVEGEAKKELFANADVVVVPSHTENFGLVVAEALAHGVPVIASRGTPWHRLEEVGCGLWVDNQPEILADTLMAARELPLREMGERGRDWMRMEFTWPHVGEQMLRLYRHLVENGTESTLKQKIEPVVSKDA